MEDSDNTEHSKEYVRQHLETQTSPENNLARLLNNPDSQFSEALINEGSVETPHFVFNGTFTKLDQEDFIDDLIIKEEDKLRAELGIEGEIPFLETGSIFGMEMGLRMRFEQNDGELYSIDRLHVKGGQDELDIVILLPEEYTTIYSPKGIVERSANDFDRKLLILSGDVTSVQGLLVLLHEIGHTHDLQDPQRLTHLQDIQRGLVLPSRKDLEEELKKNSAKSSYMDMLSYAFNQERSLTAEDVHFFLEAERNAWAFALKNMNKVLKDPDALESARRYIHENPLTMQSEHLRSKGYGFED